ncbi:L,D-transpeptidase [Nocardia paucivorans]|uniref:L,D-transpeptidase n=1 Tax=Nocardia paucivorans TaxID=114259 RepID=UPI0002D8F988|nr:L,D-transpeptidase [Nocardia paucivorans]
MHVAKNTESLSTRRRGTRRLRQSLLMTAAIAAAGTLSTAPAQAIPGLPDLPTGSAGIARPTPPPANFAPPAINPSEGETVGVAQPIIINFKEPVSDRATAEQAIKITSSNPVAGHFYWFGNKQVRWRPNEFWPAETDVVVEAGGSRSAFHIGEALIATADDNTKTITITRNGEVVRTMPTSMGKPGHETPNGTYIVGEKRRKMVMDSSTYGVPIDAPEGYKLDVEYATRISNSGIFVHAAPWSVAQQGVSNASHGCLNVSTDDAKWFFENFKKGDAVIVRNTEGGVLNYQDGLGDWNA